jgi:hypothetical protein
MIGERLRAIARWSDRRSPRARPDPSAKVAHDPREAMTGALAGLFGAFVLLALVASGLILRPAAKRPVALSVPAVTAEAPSAAPSAPAPDTSAAPASSEAAPVASAEIPANDKEQDVEPASTRRSKHPPKGGKAPAVRGIRKSDRHRDFLPTARDAP